MNTIPSPNPAGLSAESTDIEIPGSVRLKSSIPDLPSVVQMRRKKASELVSELVGRIQREGYTPEMAADLHEAGVRFIPIRYLYAIGHLSLEMDCCFKEEHLGYRPSYTMILLAPEDQVVNRHLLEYWGKYATIFISPGDCALLKPLTQVKELCYDIEAYSMRDDCTAGAFSLFREWGGRRSLLRVTNEDSRRGWQWLNRMGVPTGAWFVCVHAREPGGRPQDSGHTHRNVDIRTYFPAMEEIVSRGGWCIRMGDAAMQPLPAMINVIDYAHTPDHTDWLDIFLFGSCRFLLGCHSGPHCLTASFGVPTLLTNIGALSACGLLVNDLMIYKRIWSNREQRFHTFSEIMGSRLGAANCFANEYAQLDVTFVDSTSDEIKAAVLEMIARLDGTVQYTEADGRLQEQFRGLYKPGHYGYGSAARVGRDFLRSSVQLFTDGKPMNSTKIVIETNKAVAFDSPDHLEPWGTARDDSTNAAFNTKLYWWLPPEFMRVMDIGCSGGGFVKSIIDQGGFAVGIEGSDYSKKMRRAQWATIPDNLFTSDATAVFQLYEVGADAVRNPLKFNVITAWEFIEHIREEDLPNVMANIDRHLSPNGVVIMSVSPNEEVINGVTLHLCVHDRDWWVMKFDQLGYTCHDKAVNFFGNDMVRWEQNAPGSLHVVLTRKGERLPFPARLSVNSMGYAQHKDPRLLTKKILAKKLLHDQPLRVFDIGTEEGFGSRWDAYQKQVECVGFNRDAAESDRLNARKSMHGRLELYLPLTVAGARGQRTLYHARHEVAGSLLPPDMRFVDRFNQSFDGQVVRESTVTAVDLDSFVQETGLPYVDFIQMDAKGADLEVLRGAEKLLTEHVFGIILKVFLQPYYEGQASLSDVHAFLEQRGFRLFRMESQSWPRGLVGGHDRKQWVGKGQVMWSEMIYLKDYVGLLASGRSDYRTFEKAKVLRMVTLSEILGFEDFALELLEGVS